MKAPFSFKTKLLADTTGIGADVQGVLLPTKENILDGLEWLVRGCQPGDVLLWYYAGCTVRMVDLEGRQTASLLVVP